MVDYSWPRVQYEKNVQKIDFLNFFLDFSIDPGGPGSHPGGSRTDPGAEKHQKNEKFQNLNFLFEPGGPFLVLGAL